MREITYINGKQNLIGIFFVLLIILFHGVCNYQILSASRFNFAHDQALYYTESIRFFYGLKEAAGFKELYKLFISLGNHYRPPLFMMISGIAYFFLGLSKNAAVMSNLFFLAILLFSTYGIGTRRYNIHTGFLASFLLSIFPSIFGYIRVYYPDVSLSAIVTLSIYLFILSEDFTNLKYSLLFGLSAGLGLLTKQSYIIFILPLLIYLLLTANILKDKICLRNLFLAIFLGLALASIWYISNWSVIFYKLPIAAKIDQKDYKEWYGYITLLYKYQLLLPFFILFLIALVFFIIKKDFFLPSMVIIPLFILSLSSNKFPRFILPLYAPMALIIANFIESLDRGKHKIFTISTCSFGLAQFFLICFVPNNVPYLRPLVSWENPINNIGIYHRVDKGYWQTNEILKAITTDMSDSQQKTKILVFPNLSNLHGPLQTYSAVKRIHLHFYCPAEMDITENLPNNPELLVLDSNYIIDKTGSRGNIIRRDYVNNLYESFDEHKDKFFILKELSLPDSSTLYIYKKN